MSNIKNFGIVGVGSDVQFGKSNGRVVASGTAFKFRNATDTDFVDIQAKNLVVAGDLTVQGASTELQVDIVKVEDKNIELGVVAGGATDITAAGGGITLKGTTDKTLQWTSTGSGEWLSSENFDLASGKVYRINGQQVLGATSLGPTVVNSNLTSLGTLTSLAVSGGATFSGTVTPFAAADSGKVVKVGASGQLVTATNGVFDNVQIAGNTITATTGNLILNTTSGTGTIDVSGKKITGLQAGVDDTDAVNMFQWNFLLTDTMDRFTQIGADVAALQAKKTALNVVGTGLSYTTATETLTLTSASAATASTIVARDATGAASFSALTATGLTAQKMVYADATGKLTSAGMLSINAGGTIVTIGNLSISGDAISSSTNQVAFGGAKLTGLGAPAAATDAATKSYVDTAISNVTIPNVGHAFYNTFGFGADTTVGTVTGFVHRIKIYVTTAYTAGATISVGITGSASDLVAVGDVDPSSAGCYVIDMGKYYATATAIHAFVSGATAGAAAIVCEYV